MSPNLNIQDDLSAIKGIGPARERWLRDNFDVKTYQELAKLSISQIETRLKVEGKIVARKDIESWLNQARDLQAKSGASKQEHAGSAQGVLAHKLNSAGHENGWEPFASFLVYFQTREVDKKIAYQTFVHHMEKDQETSWPGIETSGLSAWMSQQIRDYLDLHPEDAAGASPAESQKIRPLPEITIHEVRIYQPSTAKLPIHSVKAGQFFRGELQADQPFHVGVDFSLSSKVAVDGVENEITCFARCYGCQYTLSTRISSLCAENSPFRLETGKLNYTINLPEASLPCGDYHLVIIITNSQTHRLLPDFLELASIRVDQ